MKYHGQNVSEEISIFRTDMRMKHGTSSPPKAKTVACVWKCSLMMGLKIIQYRSPEIMALKLYILYLIS